MPLWDDLGRALAADMPEYPYSGPLDAISAYEHEYTRAKLVEKLSALLLIDRARPGDVHRAFCSISFDIVCTTNLDFLLERQYEDGPASCWPVMNEDQLSIAADGSKTVLLKLHGDLHHPDRMVLTEEDYDSFLERYPLIATYLASMFISRTPILIGYSLDDPDFRRLWNTVCHRLGRLRRPAYCITVDAKPAEIARFERRGIKVISLPGRRPEYGKILAEAFGEIAEYYRSELIEHSQVTEEEPLRELSLPRDTVTRLCYFGVPLSLLSFYKEHVFPVARWHGLIPVAAVDVVSPGDYWVAKIDALMDRASAVVIDLTTPYTAFEAGFAATRLGSDRILLVLPGDSVPSSLAGVPHITRPEPDSEAFHDFVAALGGWFESVATPLERQLIAEPERLLGIREHRAAVVSAMSLLEATLRERLEGRIEFSRRPVSMNLLVKHAEQEGIVGAQTAGQVAEWMRIRNTALHSRSTIEPRAARNIVRGVMKLVSHLTG